jgi:mannose/cellobiose epimerase-like protein (N-acyl-D-glucosamine 2-epimerase family)
MCRRGRGKCSFASDCGFKVQNAIQANAQTHLTANVLSAQNAQAENAIQENVSRIRNE